MAIARYSQWKVVANLQFIEILDTLRWQGRSLGQRGSTETYHIFDSQQAMFLIMKCE